MINDKNLAHLAAIASLNHMMREGTFYITTLDEVAKALGTIQEERARQILRPLHCMKISLLPPELRENLPRLIERCIGLPAYQFETVTATNPEKVAVGTLRLLTKSS